MARTPPPRRPPRDGGIQWAKAIVLIVALVVIGIVVLRSTGKSGSGAAGAGSTTTTTSAATSTTIGGPTTTTTLLPTAQVKVLVLNGATSTQPIAGAWTTKVATKGYRTLPPDNASATVAASAIYIVTPGYLPEAQALAAAIGDPAITINQTITPSAPITPTQQATANLILVIGPDLATQVNGSAATTTTTAQNG